MSSKQTTEDFIARARIKHGDFYDYSKSVYTGGLKPLCITCPVHGDFMQKASDHANSGKGCKLCGNKRGAPKPITTEEFVARAKKVHGDRYDYSLVEYAGSRTPIIISCPLHGQFTQAPHRHLFGCGCQVCRDGKYATKGTGGLATRTKAWVERAKEKHGERYDYSEVEFKNTKTKVKIICRDHGVFLQTPGNHVNGPYGCPECGKQSCSINNTKSLEAWLSDFNNVHGTKYDYSKCTEIPAARSKIPIICPQHGVFEQVAYYHYNGNGCPVCTPVVPVSKPEDEIYEWLQRLLPATTILRSNRSTIAPYELDLLIPDRKVAIEFNGTYWHQDKFKTKDYHQKKSLLCSEKGISLIHVYEHDWETHKDRYKNLISTRVGVAGRKLDARKLEIREVLDYRKFLISNHFQGYVASQKQYGLYDHEELVSLMTFGTSRFSDTYKWELLRFCSAAGTVVRGGASRLFKHFCRTNLNPGDSVVSYARMDYSSGGVYSNLGFSLDGMCTPDYVWVHNVPGRTLKRQSTQKHKLQKLLGKSYDPALSESGNMRKAKYIRIYTSGNLRYIYTHGDT